MSHKEDVTNTVCDSGGCIFRLGLEEQIFDDLLDETGNKIKSII